MNPSHRYEVLIRATCERVWAALTDPEQTVRYFHRTRLESTFTTGARYAYRREAGDAVDGTIEVCEPPHRLVMTWHVLYDAAMSAEPPSRVEWTLTPATADGSITRVTVRHGDLALSPRTWASVRHGWVAVIDGLKSWLETGEALPAVDDPSDADDAADDADDDASDGAWHRAQAVAANNSAWELLDGRQLTAPEGDDLLARAYAAMYHWLRAAGATTTNAARASWLASRCHVVLGHGELALHHAERSAALVAAAGEEAADFDRAYAHEATARALACLGRTAEAATALDAARAVPIADDEDRAILDGDLSAGPWFALAEELEAAT